MFTICTENCVPLEALAAIPVPERTNVSALWRGVNHGDLAEEILRSCIERGLYVVESQWGTNKSESDLFGAIELAPNRSHDIALPEGMGLALGVRHSNAGRYAVTFAVGARVFVCKNGVLTGDFLVSHKHTIALVLPELIGLALDRYLTEARQLSVQVEAMRNMILSAERAAQVILDAAYCEELPPRYVMAVWREWLTPTHADFLPRTAWSLHNAFTTVAQQLALPSQYKLLRALPHRVMSAPIAQISAPALPSLFGDECDDSYAGPDCHPQRQYDVEEEA